FRIFNPTTQGERFDRDGEFIRQWLPALRDIPGKAIHEPWRWAGKAGVVLIWLYQSFKFKSRALAVES
ncbi:hypothetical protein KU614_22205, partial [Salmonella enterica subsp. enterica serovar Give]|nr:hypothetical protein [Salmonella enterica subsp. enterica serovar Give]